MAVRTFIRGLFSKDYNLDMAEFANYNEVVDFVNNYDFSLRVTPNGVALLKRRPVNKRKIIMLYDSVKDFLTYIKTKFPEFDDAGFLGK